MSDIINISEVIDLSVQEYTNASFQVIKQLQAKISKLETENESLLRMLEQNTPALIHTSDLTLGIPQEQLICEAQIHMIKEQAIVRVLTKEECQKFEILTNILHKYKIPIPTSDEILIKRMTQEELIAVALKEETPNV